MKKLLMAASILFAATISYSGSITFIQGDKPLDSIFVQKVIFKTSPNGEPQEATLPKKPRLRNTMQGPTRQRVEASNIPNDIVNIRFKGKINSQQQMVDFKRQNLQKAIDLLRAGKDITISTTGGKLFLVLR